MNRSTKEAVDFILKKSILIRGSVIMRDSKNPEPINNLEKKLRRVILDGQDEEFSRGEFDVAAELIDRGVRSQILDALQVVQDPERDNNEELGRQMIERIRPLIRDTY